MRFASLLNSRRKWGQVAAAQAPAYFDVPAHADAAQRYYAVGRAASALLAMVVSRRCGYRNAESLRGCPGKTPQRSSATTERTLGRCLEKMDNRSPANGLQDRAGQRWGGAGFWLCLLPISWPRNGATVPIGSRLPGTGL